MKRLLALFFLALSLSSSASLPPGAPEQNGMSPERLNRINGVMNKHVEDGDLAGASGLISRNGKVVFRATWGDYKPDTIVRMYSMTKGVTGVAAMILYEDGLYSMNDPPIEVSAGIWQDRGGKGGNGRRR
jgi:CubicO group peptidase (beta-lactamase class C family)